MIDSSAAETDSLKPEELYQELRRLARRISGRRNVGITLQPTDLVHEVFLRLAKGKERKWDNPEDLLNLAACAMRNLLMDYFRSKQALKRGGGQNTSSLDEFMCGVHRQNVDLIALNEALEELESAYPRMAKVVELRFFFRFSEEEIAEILDLAVRTVARDWAFAKNWLYGRLYG
ncbi:MAG: RNA polymerase subunit sigma [Planctomycetota bacterium]|nr:MAG: RNA polymerase subunit sigma [Planctomycetota bacterium]